MINWFENLDEELQVALFIMFLPGVMVLTIGLAVTFIRILWVVLGL